MGFLNLAFDVAFGVYFLFFLGLALVFALIAWRFFKARRPVLGCLLAVVTLGSIAIPNWGRLPGRMLAEKTCREVGKVRSQARVPVRVDSIYYEGRRDISRVELNKLLLEGGFAFVEHSAPKSSDVWAYRIEPTNLGRCSFASEHGESVASSFIGFYEHGMKFDECLAHFKQPRTMAAVRYSESEETRWFPLAVSITSQQYTDTATDAEISSLNSFRYVPLMNSSAMDRLAVNCNVGEKLKYRNHAGLVVGSAATRSWPNTIQPADSTLPTVVIPLDVRHIEIGMSQLDADQYVRYYRDGMDLRPDGLQVWRPRFIDTHGKTRISWGEGAEASTVEAPPFSRATADRIGLFSLERTPTPESLVKVLAAKRLDGSVVLIRSYQGIWEVAEYDVGARAWRRNIADLSSEEIVGGPNSLPLMFGVEVAGDRITLKGLTLEKSSAGQRVKNGFRLVFPRP